MLAADGLPPVAAVALVPWALCASRPGPRAFPIEWLAGGLGCAALMGFVWYVFPPGVLAIGLVQGAYMAGAGALLRRLHPRLGLWLAAPLAWLCLETLRSTLPVPPGLAWWRIGHGLADVPLLLGSARIWGVGGLGFVLAACAGGLADGWRLRCPLRVLPGLAPGGLALVLTQLVPAPETEPGPRLLLVQPGFAQEVKSAHAPFELFHLAREQTAADLDRRAAAGEPPPDLVCWGESMLDLSLSEPELLEGLGELEWDRWARALTRTELERLAFLEDQLVRRIVMGLDLEGEDPVEGALPPGTSFLSGTIVWVPRKGRVERRNGIALWDAGGRRGPTVGKTWLVPGAESMMGLERLDAVRSFVFDTANYVPDLRPYPGTGTLELVARDGRSYRFSGTVCFDNAFVQPYAEVTRRERVDFHLVVSNEAWYRESWEMDQMLAFSRCIAAATGRAVVRATNSGVTALIGADGSELQRLTVGDRDRLVAGTLAVRVPVPAGGAAPGPTPWARLERIWHALWIALPLILAAVFRRRSDGYRAGGTG